MPPGGHAGSVPYMPQQRPRGLGRTQSSRFAPKGQCNPPSPPAQSGAEENKGHRMLDPGQPSRVAWRSPSFAPGNGGRCRSWGGQELGGCCFVCLICSKSGHNRIPPLHFCLSPDGGITGRPVLSPITVCGHEGPHDTFPTSIAKGDIAQLCCSAC